MGNAPEPSSGPATIEQFSNNDCSGGPYYLYLANIDINPKQFKNCDAVLTSSAFSFNILYKSLGNTKAQLEIKISENKYIYIYLDINDGGEYSAEKTYPQFEGYSNGHSDISVIWINDGFSISDKTVIYSIARMGRTWNFMIFLRKNHNNTLTNGKVDKLTPINVNFKQNPDILIISQLLIDNSDIGDTLFELKNDDKQSMKFERSCPKVYSVLKGKGLTARNKVNYLYKTEQINVDGLKFVDNLIKYSMVKYFLAKILYDKWNIKYLLNKYNFKFINDLKNSRFNSFVDFFIDPQSDVYGYNKYFL